MAVSVFHKIKPKIGRRPLNADLHRLWRRHAHQVGEVITAWNDLQAGFFLIFQTLSETKNPKSSAIALAIWHSIQSDSAQREMMLSVARAALPENSRAYSQIKWLKDRADKLTPFRNDPAHTPIAFMRTDEHGNIAVSPNVFVSKEAAYKRLTERPLQKTWRPLRGDFYALAIFSELLGVALINPDMPLPRRPRIRSIPASVQPKRRKRRGNASPLPPPSSSLG